jgi:pentatricopeptide repeat protein
VGVLKACANVAVIEEDRCVHQQIIQSHLESDVFVGSSLVDMYPKCGSIEDAGNVFKKMSSRDVVSCTVMILGHMQCREGQKAFELFEQML